MSYKLALLHYREETLRKPASGASSRLHTADKTTNAGKHLKAKYFSILARGTSHGEST